MALWLLVNMDGDYIVNLRTGQTEIVIFHSDDIYPLKEDLEKNAFLLSKRRSVKNSPFLHTLLVPLEDSKTLSFVVGREAEMIETE